MIALLLLLAATAVAGLVATLAVIPGDGYRRIRDCPTRTLER